MNVFTKNLFLQIITVPLIMSVFFIVETKHIAGAMAGSFFLVSSLYYLNQVYFKTRYLKTFSFYGILFHLFLAVFPLIWLRIFNWGVPFESLSFLGIPAPSFHKISETVYLIMVLCTLLDLLRLMVLKIPLSSKVN